MANLLYNSFIINIYFFLLKCDDIIHSQEISSVAFSKCGSNIVPKLGRRLLSHSKILKAFEKREEKKNAKNFSVLKVGVYCIIYYYL